LNALVTGGAGFIGSHLVRALLDRGDAVRVLDNMSTGHAANVAGLDVDFVEGDLRSYERVSTAVRGTDAIFHLGALPSVPRSIQDPLTSNAVNVEGTLNVLLAARDAGVRRIVFASSSSIYGQSPDMPRTETQRLAPLSPYAVSKMAAEQYVIALGPVYGVETTALRYFNVFGERQDALSGYAAVIPRFIRTMLAGKRPTVFGDGSASRDFTHVANVVDATIAAAAAPGAPGLAINVAMGQQRTVNELVDALGEVTGASQAPVYAEPRLGDVKDSVADISRAREVLGYEPKVDFVSGLRRTVDWLAARPAD
jgi:UDP-glucose 4-epimerase